MEIHHIGYLTDNIHRTSKEFFFLKFSKSKIIKDKKFKVDICFLKEIPKGATGKLQRIGLAEKLG